MMPDEFGKRRLKPEFPRWVLRKALARVRDAHDSLRRSVRWPQP